MFQTASFDLMDKQVILLTFMRLVAAWKDRPVSDLRTLYAASYDSDRVVLYNSTTGLTYTLPGKRNEHPGDEIIGLFEETKDEVLLGMQHSTDNVESESTIVIYQKLLM
ncbi:hypothetical protein pdam_00018429 [Pocillopora damicornis]|uniref:Uncharacterized protein n=1 Tax=Pocillopora damicornis TaxID=46731 RepID=A0A3M6U902_POCDA|nr:hypothetical protein pdam_00018429 [Pocillopora damicornis]